MANKIKIAHLVSSRTESLSGGDLVILNLLKYLDENKFVCWLGGFKEARRPGLSFMTKTAQQRDVKTFLIDSRGKFDFKSVRQLQQFILDNQIDILHCHGYKANVVGFLISRKMRIKKITTLHGWWYGKSPKLNLYNLLNYYVIRHFDKIIAVSEPIKTVLIKKRFPVDKLVYIPNGLDLECIQTADSQRIRKELSLIKDALIVGTAGRLSKEKGHKYLLAAIKDIPDVVLLIVGSGPLQKKLIEMTNKLKIKKRVIFTGFRHDVHDFIAAMDIFVLPSLSEGLPLALLEAMAAQKPVIASNVGGIPTVIKNKETGILIEPKNSDLLTKAIMGLLNNRELGRQMSINAKKLIEQDFSSESMAKKYEAIYLEVSKNKND